MMRRLYEWVDDRLGTSRFVRTSLDKVFPDNWSFMLGEIALYCFVVLVLTGTYLTFFFTPSAKEVVYDGTYAPLHGVRMSEAYQSTVKLSFDVRAGLVFRQMHHWAALIFAGAVLVHLCRVFFTGAFRRPREINWVIGVTLFVLVIFNGFAGYSLPDDLLSGTGLRIGYSIALGVPVVGTWLAFLVFGGEFPAPDILSRLFVIHVLLLPAAIVALLGGHLAILWHQKHTQFPGRGRTEANIVGSRLWPTYAARSLGLLFGVFALIALLGGLVQVNPIWLYGPFEPAAVTTASQPDWYMGWLEGALRLFPRWRVHAFGFTLSELFWPGVLLPTLTFGLLYAWPFIEARVTGDHAEHHLLDRPRYRPWRTALGTAVLSFYVVLFVAGSQDIGAEKLATPIPTVTWTLRILALALPPLVFALTWKVCHDVAGAEELEARKHSIRAYPEGARRDAVAARADPETRRSRSVLARALRAFGKLAFAAVIVVLSALVGRARRGRAP